MLTAEERGAWLRLSKTIPLGLLRAGKVPGSRTGRQRRSGVGDVTPWLATRGRWSRHPRWMVTDAASYAFGSQIGYQA